MAIRLRVDVLLRERKLNTQALADKAGISYNTALALQRGSMTQIKFDTLDRVCAALGVMPGEIFEYEPASPTSKSAKKKPSS